MTLLRAQALSKAFPGVQALDSVDLEIRAGEIHALVGENGAGKSTLVKTLGGAIRPDSGTATLAGKPLPFGDPIAARDCGVGIIYQEFTLVPELDIAENIFLGQERTRRGFLRRSEMRREAREWMERLGCDLDPRTLVKGLSVGLCQLVEIARALATGSRLLIFDEPSATLTDQELDRLFEVMSQLRAEGIGMIYISHRLEEIDRICDRVTVLRDGCSVATGVVAETSRDQLIRWMVGREIQENDEAAATDVGPVRLEVRRLGRAPYFRDVSFAARAGEILGLAGLVGAGRTSVALSLFGVLPPDSGEIALDGQAVRFRHPWEALSAGVGYLTEDRKGRGIFAQLSVAENITVSTLADYTRGGLLAPSRRKAAAQQACDRFDVRTASLDKKIGELSGGNQQKALLARLLLHPLKVLILDEPTRGVDVGARAEVYPMIRQLSREGVAVVIISSDLPELLQLSDRVVVLREGYSMGELHRDEATQESVMTLATAEVKR